MAKAKIEDKFEQISTIIETLEQPATPLTESLKLYTQGVKLLKECNDELDKVEKQLIILDEEEQHD
ncbi:MAG: exodeoxyribonuclease VII small subunit [Lachnospiraceae bacterium]|nr:exodeoxyribonuclease VII small subunit [Lachnospiraceae bacterium]